MQGQLVDLNGLLAGNKLFDVPAYQGSYAWRRENLLDLWEDLYYLDPTKKHYFGTVLLKDSGQTADFGLLSGIRYDVIDGQQRITTSLILLRELFSQISEYGNDDLKANVKELERDYLKANDQYKLNLHFDDQNERSNDREFFHRFIIDQESSERSDVHTFSQQRLIRAQAFFKEQLRQERRKRGQERYVKFLESMTRKIINLQIMQYIIDSESDAVRMFETVNDRGRPLTNLEKTKSFLMHSVYLGVGDHEDAVEVKIGELNSKFANIYDYFEDIDKTSYSGPPTEDDIQRYYAVCRGDTRRDQADHLDRLKDEVRDLIRTEPSKGVLRALEYSNGLESAFWAVKDLPEARDDANNPLSQYIDRVILVDRLANVFPLLIASWLKYKKEPEVMKRILRLVESFMFRAYVVGGLRSNTARTYFYEAASNIHNGNWNTEVLIEKLKCLNRDYMDDVRFTSYLQSPEFVGRVSSAHIRYLFSEYETHLTGSTLWRKRLLSPSYEVEHIWPTSSARRGLPSKIRRGRFENIDKLGNLTVVSKADNKLLGNKTFPQKTRIFGDGKARPRIQTDLARIQSWDASVIKQREDKLVAFALERWSVNDV